MADTATESSAGAKLTRQRRVAWAVLLIFTLTVLSSVIIPVGLIMPFRPQSPGGLAFAYTLRRWSPSLTLVAAGVVIALIVWLWRGTRWWGKPALAIALILTITS